jgi:hypothetical protein
MTALSLGFPGPAWHSSFDEAPLTAGFRKTLQRPRAMKIPAILLIGGVLFSGLPPEAQAGNGQWTLTGWNNLGMHCMDDDYSVFSILPPFNTVNAQLLDQHGKRVTDPAALGISMTYEAIEDPDGSINTTSVGKTNFWQYAGAAYDADLTVDAGLGGTRMPGPANLPRVMKWDPGMSWFEALGIPITPTDDAGHHNPYPLMRLTARNAAGVALAEVDVVLPVSAEMDCRACHASGTGPEARPAAGWVNSPDGKRDFRLNILRLHDEHRGGSPLYQAALATHGYSAKGLYDSAVNQATPALCAKCHASEALGTGGYPGVATVDPRHACQTCHGDQSHESASPGFRGEPQFLLSMPSRLQHQVPARRDGQCRGGGRQHGDAVPELPWRHGRGGGRHPHRLAAGAHLPILSHRGRREQRRLDPVPDFF